MQEKAPADVEKILPWNFLKAKSRLQVEITERKETEKQLRHRIDLEKMLARIASLTLEIHDADTFLETCATIMGSCLDVSRIYIFKSDPGNNLLTNTHEWTAPGISPEKENLQEIPETVLPWWSERMKQNKIIDFENIEDMPGAEERALLRSQNIKSVLVVPLRLNNRYYGFFGFDECRRYRKWAKEDVEILKTVGSLIQKYIESKEMEQSLKNSEEKYRRVVEKLHEGILIFRGRKILYANPQMTKFFGISRNEFLQRNLFDGVHPDDMAYVLDLFKKAMSGETLPEKSVKLRFIKLNGTGSVIDLELKGELIEYDGKSAVLVLARDITEEKKTLTLLKESETKYRMLTENLVDGICLGRSNPFRYLYVNQTMEAITGYSVEELLASEEKHFRESIDSTEFDMILNYFNHIIPKSKSPVKYEHRMKKKDGATVWLSVSAAPLSFNGEPAFLASISDISDRKHLESQLQHSQKMEAVGTLAGGIAHDFNNILNGILGYAEIGKLEIPDGVPGKENLDMVIKSGIKARDLIKQILSFSRRHEPELKPIKLAPVISESVQLLRSSLPSFIEIAVDIFNDKAVIEGDGIQIHQLILNLCTNAAHAMEEKGGIVRISLDKIAIQSGDHPLHMELFQGNYVNLRVSDNGKGMEPWILERIFEPYFTTKEAGKGTGLGLAAVHGIVKSHKGVIMVESHPGVRTEFSIFFPEIIREATDFPPAFHEKPETGTGRILVVDDEEDLANIAKTLLTHYGYEATAFTNPLEALDCFNNKPTAFDLVITDMTMPQLTGEKLALELMKTRPDVPIIICSGYLEAFPKKMIQKNNAWAFLPKPLVLEELLSTVKRLVQTP
jgi:PAS domain S-box-containing protein